MTILTYVRDAYVETRLNRPDRLTKHSVAVTILTSETIMWKPGLIVQIAWQNILWQWRSLRTSETIMCKPGLIIQIAWQNILRQRRSFRTSETIMWKPGLIVQIAWQNILWQWRSLRQRRLRGNQALVWTLKFSYRFNEEDRYVFSFGSTFESVFTLIRFRRKRSAF